VSNKKAPNLYRMGLLAYFVTPKVEKSNFYMDLEEVLEWEDTFKNTVNGKKR
jgi:hypothetical protein